tara:strand:- start:1813 stop:2406 length:594 start_codon:yes stop_codon:yes gene_type:complete
MKRASSGFTLIEILVALLIFAVIGLLSSQLLTRSLDARGHLDERGERLAQVHRAMQIVQRDLLQLASRPVRAERDERLSSLIISDEGVLEMSRLGWRNPLGHARSSIQRVSYRLQDDKLIRGYWPVLDRPEGLEPAVQTLLEDVDRVEFFAVDADNKEHKFWPTPDGAIRLQAIILRVELAPFGFIERIWDISSVPS